MLLPYLNNRCDPKKVCSWKGGGMVSGLHLDHRQVHPWIDKKTWDPRPKKKVRPGAFCQVKAVLCEAPLLHSFDFFFFMLCRLRLMTHIHTDLWQRAGVLSQVVKGILSPQVWGSPQAGNTDGGDRLPLTLGSAADWMVFWLELGSNQFGAMGKILAYQFQHQSLYSYTHTKILFWKPASNSTWATLQLIILLMHSMTTSLTWCMFFFSIHIRLISNGNAKATVIHYKEVWRKYIFNLTDTSRAKTLANLTKKLLKMADSWWFVQYTNSKKIYVCVNFFPQRPVWCQRHAWRQGRWNQNVILMVLSYIFQAIY